MQVTTPFPFDFSTGTSFHRMDNNHLVSATKFHNDTNGYGDFLGEWHTHPNGSSTSPSHKDLLAFSSAQNLTTLPLIHIIASTKQVDIYTSGGKHVGTYL